MPASTFKNTLLRHLEPEVVDRLSLRPVTFELKHEIEFPGQPIEHLFFVEEGVASMTTAFQDGSQVEVGMFGFESVIGVSALMGTKLSLNRIYTQVPGRGYSSPLQAAQLEFSRCGRFQALALRFVQAQLLQAVQSAGCNAKHHIEQRLARWLLICADRAHAIILPLSQEFLADMLGSTRPTVSIAASTLRDEGLIDYTRGVVTLLDVARLEQRSCECYCIIKQYFDSYAEFDTAYTR
ncbi:MAG TPA: Crp/Fnr family transcriptional regulator [Acidobacteriaceae bacterium]